MNLGSWCRCFIMKEEEDRKPKWDIDKECPNSALVDYK
jgi:hypothetical protein